MSKDDLTGPRAFPFDEEEELWVVSRPRHAASLPALTDAEREVAALIGEGLNNTEIAARRGTSINTIANQLRSIYVKLSINSRSELVILMFM